MTAIASDAVALLDERRTRLRRELGTLRQDFAVNGTQHNSVPLARQQPATNKFEPSAGINRSSSACYPASVANARPSSHPSNKCERHLLSPATSVTLLPSEQSEVREGSAADPSCLSADIAVALVSVRKELQDARAAWTASDTELRRELEDIRRGHAEQRDSAGSQQPSRDGADAESQRLSTDITDLLFKLQAEMQEERAFRWNGEAELRSELAELKDSRDDHLEHIGSLLRSEVTASFVLELERHSLDLSASLSVLQGELQDECTARCKAEAAAVQSMAQIRKELTELTSGHAEQINADFVRLSSEMGEGLSTAQFKLQEERSARRNAEAVAVQSTDEFRKQLTELSGSHAERIDAELARLSVWKQQERRAQSDRETEFRAELVEVRDSHADQLAQITSALRLDACPDGSELQLLADGGLSSVRDGLKEERSERAASDAEVQRELAELKRQLQDGSMSARSTPMSVRRVSFNTPPPPVAEDDAELAHCPASHRLVRRILEDEAACDRCGEDVYASAETYCCRECNYDLCHTCYNTHLNAPESTSPA